MIDLQNTGVVIYYERDCLGNDKNCESYVLPDISIHWYKILQDFTVGARKEWEMSKKFAEFSGEEPPTEVSKAYCDDAISVLAFAFDKGRLEKRFDVLLECLREYGTVEVVDAIPFIKKLRDEGPKRRKA
jgi:hypothetical protein